MQQIAQTAVGAVPSSYVALLAATGAWADVSSVGDSAAGELSSFLTESNGEEELPGRKKETESSAVAAIKTLEQILFKTLEKTRKLVEGAGNVYDCVSELFEDAPRSRGSEEGSKDQSEVDKESAPGKRYVERRRGPRRVRSGCCEQLRAQEEKFANEGGALEREFRRLCASLDKQNRTTQEQSRSAIEKLKKAYEANI